VGASWREAVGNGVAIGMSPPVLTLVDELRDFMFANVYLDSPAKSDESKTHFIVRQLFEHFCRRPADLPAEFLAARGEDPLERRVADYIAGMTDRYAIQTFERLYVPQQWAVLS
jgi:dGTPase